MRTISMTNHYDGLCAITRRFFSCSFISRMRRQRPWTKTVAFVVVLSIVKSITENVRLDCMTAVINTVNSGIVIEIESMWIDDEIRTTFITTNYFSFFSFNAAAQGRIGLFVRIQISPKVYKTVANSVLCTYMLLFANLGGYFFSFTFYRMKELIIYIWYFEIKLNKLLNWRRFTFIISFIWPIFFSRTQHNNYFRIDRTPFVYKKLKFAISIVWLK